MAVSKSIVWSAIGVGVQNITQVACLVVLARFISPSEYGVITIVTLLVQVVSTIALYGISQAVVHFQFKGPNELLLFKQIVVIRAVFGMIVVTFLSILFFQWGWREEHLIVVGILLPVIYLQNANMMSEAICFVHLDVKKISIIQSAAYFIGYGVVSILFAVSGFGMYSIPLAVLGMNLIKYVAYFKLKEKGEEGEGVDFPVERSKKYRLNTLASQLGIVGATNVDNVIVVALYGEGALGNYGRAYSLLLLPSNLIGSVIERVAFPVFSKGKHDYWYLREVLAEFLVLGASLSIVTAGVMYVTAGQVVVTLLGEDWIEVIQIFEVLIIALPGRVMQKIMEGFFKGVGLTTPLVYMPWVSTLLLALLCAVHAAEGVGQGVAMAVVQMVYIICFFNALILCRWFRSVGSTEKLTGGRRRLTVLCLALVSLYLLLFPERVSAGMLVCQGVVVLVFFAVAFYSFNRALVMLGEKR